MVGRKDGVGIGDATQPLRKERLRLATGARASQPVESFGSCHITPLRRVKQKTRHDGGLTKWQC
jgi:hypothetical protein